MTIRPRALGPGTRLPPLLVLLPWLLVGAGVVGVGVFGAAAAGAQEIRASARLSHTAVGVDDPVYLEIEVQGPGFQQPRLRPHFELQNLRRVGEPSVFKNVSMGFGGSTWVYRWTWALMPLELGAARVGDLRVTVGTQEVSLAPKSLQVLARTPPGIPPTGSLPRSRFGQLRPPGADGRRPDPRQPGRQSPRQRLEELLQGLQEGLRGEAPGAPDRGEDAAPVEPLILSAEVDDPTPWAGQRVTYTVYLYSRVEVLDMTLMTPPSFEGFWAADGPGGPLEPGRRVVVDGRVYRRTPLLRHHLHPLGPGRHRIDALDARFAVPPPLGSLRTSVDPVVWLARTSNPVDLTVRPLPAPPPGTPAPFSGPVGRLALDARLEPAEVEVGRSTTYTLTLEGTAHLDGLEAPRLALPEGVVALPPQEVASPAPGATPRPAGGGPAERPGRRAWAWTLIPRHTGSWRIPPVEIVHFDPEAGRYRTARSAETRLTAHYPELGTEPPVRTASRLPPPDAVTAPEEAATRVLPAWLRAPSPLEWTLGAGALAALLTLIALVGVSRRTRSRPSRAEERFREALAAARAEPRPRRAAQRVEAALRALLEEAADLPADRTPGEWPAALAGAGASAATRAALEAALAELRALRHAPELADTEPLVAAVERPGLELARGLRQDFP